MVKKKRECTYRRGGSSRREERGGRAPEREREREQEGPPGAGPSRKEKKWRGKKEDQVTDSMEYQPFLFPFLSFQFKTTFAAICMFADTSRFNNSPNK